MREGLEARGYNPDTTPVDVLMRNPGIAACALEDDDHDLPSSEGSYVQTFYGDNDEQE